LVNDAKLTCFNKTVRQPAHETIELLTMETPEFIHPMLWPPNSPDLNPVEYKVWLVMQEKVYKKLIEDIDELRAGIPTAWDEMDQRIIDAAIRQWRTSSSLVHALKPKADTMNTH